MPVMWAPDPAVEAARATAAWAAFMRLCGRERVFFEHVQRLGGGGYGADAYTTRQVRGTGGYAHQALSQGRGDTPAAAVFDALGQSGVTVAGAAEALGGSDDDFDGLLGGDAPVAAVTVVDEWEGLLGE